LNNIENIPNIAIYSTSQNKVIHFSKQNNNKITTKSQQNHNKITKKSQQFCFVVILLCFDYVMFYCFEL